MHTLPFNTDVLAIEHGNSNRNDPSASSPQKHPNKFKLIAIVNVIVQLLLPVSISFTPMIAAAASQQASVATVAYQLKVNETVYSVAKKYGLTVDELKKLNQFRTFSRPFNQLTAGDEIDVPSNQKTIISPEEISQSLDSEDKLAKVAVAGARLLSNGGSSASAISMGRSAVVSEVNTSTQQWLNQFGTARLQLNVNDDFHLDGSALDILLPLSDKSDRLFFTQLGARNKDSRNTINIGGGARAFYNHWMYGINGFFDNDMTGNNRRFGVGVEVWTDYLKLSANQYIGTTDWHQSRDFADYNERPANGYDVRLEAYLSNYPQLGGKLMYEKYKGNEVALFGKDKFGKDKRQKDPYAATAGLNYTPIPLLTLGTEYRVGKGSYHDGRLNLQLNYRLGESWRSQINPAAVAASRTLQGSRLDLVERNNQIVLDYQKQDLIQLALPEKITGEAGNVTTVTASVVAKYGVERIDWDSRSLIAAGGSISQTSATTVTLTLPPYQTDQSSGNNYTLAAIAYDHKGNASNRAISQIVVTGQAITAQTSATPDTLPANGIATSTITVDLKDADNQPVAGMASQLTLQLNFVPSVSVNNTIQPNLLTTLTESSPGLYTATLTAGTQAGEVTITPRLNNQMLMPVSVALTPEQIAPGHSVFIATPDIILANNHATSAITFTARDANNLPVSGLAVSFQANQLAGTSIGAITEVNGVYSANLKGSIDGIEVVHVLIGSDVVGSVLVRLRPEAKITAVSVNGATFDAGSQFPKTGFAGANFKLLINGNVYNNYDYDWESSDGAVMVSPAGITMTGVPNGEVTITATDQLLPENKAIYTFRLATWFINNGNTSMSYTAADSWCASQPGGYATPSYTKMIDDNSSESLQRLANGRLINEWGTLHSYSGWYQFFYWARETKGSSRYFVSSSGWLLDNGGTNNISYVACSRDL